MVNPFAASPTAGSPFMANPMQAYGFPQQMSAVRDNFYRSGLGGSQAGQSTMNPYNNPGGVRGMERRIMSDYQREVDKAVSNESIYGGGPGQDPRINGLLDTLEDIGIASEDQARDVRRESEFEETVRDGGNVFTNEEIRLNDKGEEEKKQVQFKIIRNPGGPATYRELDDNGEFVNTEEEDRRRQQDSQDRARRTRITLGRTINETELGRMIGDSQDFGDSRNIQDAANTIVDDIMRQSGAPRFGPMGSGDDVRGRGVMSREITNAIMEEMTVKDSDGKSTGKFNTDAYGDAQTSSTVLKAFAKSGMNEFDDAMKEFVSSAGDVQVTVDKDSLIQNVMPKVKKMVDTMETLKDIYNEADPEKLMRIAAEVTGLNPNVGRNADKINSQVAQMTEMAEMAGVKPAQFMNQVVSTAQALTEQGFGQRMAGQTAQRIVASSHFESLAQRSFGTDPDAGGFHAMTPEDIMRRQVMTQGAMLNEKSGMMELYAGAQRLANDQRRGGNGLSDETNAFLNRAIESGSSQDFKELAKMVSQETGQNLFQLGRNPMEMLQRLGKEEDFYDFANNQMFERNKIRFTEGLGRDGTFQIEGKDKVDDEGNLVFKEKTQEEQEQILNEIEEEASGEEVKKLEDKFVEREKAKFDENGKLKDGATPIFERRMDGEFQRDRDGNLVFLDTEEGRKAKEQFERDSLKLKQENSPFELDENGERVMKDGKPVFKDTPAGQEAKKRFEEEKFVRDEQGEKITEKEQFTTDDAELFSVISGVSSREDLRKILAISSGEALGPDGQFIGEDLETEELNKQKQELDDKAEEQKKAIDEKVEANELTQAEADEQKKEIDRETQAEKKKLDDADRERRISLTTDLIVASDGFRKTVEDQVNVEMLAEQDAIDKQEAKEVQQAAEEKKKQIDEKVQAGEMDEDEAQKAKDQIDEDTAEQVEEIDNRSKERLKEVANKMELDDEAAEQFAEEFDEKIGVASEAIQERMEEEEKEMEELNREAKERGEDMTSTEYNRRKKEIQDKTKRVKRESTEETEGQAVDAVAQEMAVELVDIQDKMTEEGQERIRNNVINQKERDSTAIGTFTNAGSKESRDAIIEAARKRESQEKMEKIFAGDFTGEGGFLDGFMTDDAQNKSMEDRIAEHEFTEEELAQAEDLIPERMDEIEDEIVTSMVNQDTNTANERTKKFFENIKAPKSQTERNIKSTAIEYLMQTGDYETKEDAEKAFNELNTKVQNKDGKQELSAQEQKQVKDIGRLALDEDRRGSEEDKEGMKESISDTLGSEKQSNQYEALSEALESLRQSIENQAEEKGESDEVSKVTFEEGTVFQAVLSPDLKTITMRSE
tara:strand:- start:1038 stop:5057 length:4020 start_codon:yes stop_codon:yes gene_type:complete